MRDASGCGGSLPPRRRRPRCARAPTRPAARRSPRAASRSRYPSLSTGALPWRRRIPRHAPRQIFSRLHAPKSTGSSAMAEFMDEDAIVDAVETAEASGDCAAVVELLGRALDLEEPRPRSRPPRTRSCVSAATRRAVRRSVTRARARVAAAPQARRRRGLARRGAARLLPRALRRLRRERRETARGRRRRGAVRAMGAHAAAGEPTLQEQGCLAVEALAAAGGAAARGRCSPRRRGRRRAARADIVASGTSGVRTARSPRSRRRAAQGTRPSKQAPRGRFLDFDLAADARSRTRPYTYDRARRDVRVRSRVDAFRRSRGAPELERDALSPRVGVSGWLYATGALTSLVG